KMSQNTIYRDLRDMDQWLPQVFELRDNAEEAAIDLLRMVKVAQNRLLQLSHVADSGSAQVGAAKALLDSFDKEIKLRTVTGQFKPVTQKHEIGVSIPELSAEDIARYTPVIIQAVLEAEIGAADPDDDPEDSEESLDNVGPSS
ncbi:unnamed protein product, partial [marine sediment metagenome]